MPADAAGTEAEPANVAEPQPAVAAAAPDADEMDSAHPEQSIPPFSPFPGPVARGGWLARG